MSRTTKCSAVLATRLLFIPGDATKIVFNAPGAKGANYGGQNSYGHNDAWMSPADPVNGGPSGVSVVAQASVDRPAGTVLIGDGSYYGLVPDVMNQSGLLDASKFTAQQLTDLQTFVNNQGVQYKSYWKNIGNANWSATGGDTGPMVSAAAAVSAASVRHNGTVNCMFVDGHAKALQYKKVIGDLCLWVRDSNNTCN